MSKESSVADHCMQYARSNSNDRDFQALCDHQHTDHCERCDALTTALADIQKALASMTEENIGKDAKEEVRFIADQAISSIQAWKAHLLRSLNQDQAWLDVIDDLDDSSVSSAVLAIMEDVIGKLKAIIPSLKAIFYRQDNAGCYRSGATITGAPKAGHVHGVTIKRLDFSDPQGGKGSCDRKAATIKAHMKVHLNEGNDIENARQMG